MQNLPQLFREYLAAKQYVLPGQTVLLAVSGGADSMAMVHLFLKTDVDFAIAHCNFGLRGVESDMDEALVNDWCSEHKIVFHTTRFDTKQKTEEWKKGTQETARILRYEWFEQIRKEFGYAKIATAHHANDNVETLLINLCKGTGIAGIHGILPVNGNIIRPLLFAEKDAIRQWVEMNKISYREDASNDTDDYLRNAIRHKLVPVMQELFPNVINNVNDSIGRFGEAEVLYKRAIAQESKQLIERRGQDHYIPVLKLRNRKPLATICYELLLPFGFSAAQVPNVISLLDAESGHYVSSGTHRIIRNRDFLVVTAAVAEEADLVLIESLPCTVDTGRFRFSFSVQPKPKNIPADPNEAWLDMKGITFPLVLRRWKTGDYLYPFGMKMKKKKVSRLFIDQKVPLHEKEHIRILETGKRIAWVSGIRPDERFRIKNDTEQVLVVKCVPVKQP